ncbi:hypothetical protein KS4_00430 [Poriferisphaera corsica]|uniref:Exo-alpha-sialidase n=1 Tax=Poriferisphaera corsica TaxID=2528020 RepID=A0A517YP64_9BACT|nr:hypothetical protein [Poriferisphaera corsica]QDU32015.1 hypothetical protein KS4_00430 [Poriferisphaera corsica]
MKKLLCLCLFLLSIMGGTLFADASDSVLAYWRYDGLTQSVSGVPYYQNDHSGSGNHLRNSNGQQVYYSSSVPFDIVPETLWENYLSYWLVETDITQLAKFNTDYVNYPLPSSPSPDITTANYDLMTVELNYYPQFTDSSGNPNLNVGDIRSLLSCYLKDGSGYVSQPFAVAMFAIQDPVSSDVLGKFVTAYIDNSNNMHFIEVPVNDCIVANAANEKWYSIRVVKSNTAFELWVDGELKASEAISGAQTTFKARGSGEIYQWNLGYGRDHINGIDGYTAYGRLDEIRISNKVVDQSNLLETYTWNVKEEFNGSGPFRSVVNFNGALWGVRNGPHEIVELINGEYVVKNLNDGNNAIHLFRSTDNGKTWQRMRDLYYTDTDLRDPSLWAGTVTESGGTATAKLLLAYGIVNKTTKNFSVKVGIVDGASATTLPNNLSSPNLNSSSIKTIATGANITINKVPNDPNQGTMPYHTFVGAPFILQTGDNSFQVYYDNETITPSDYNSGNGYQQITWRKLEFNNGSIVLPSASPIFNDIPIGATGLTRDGMATAVSLGSNKIIAVMEGIKTETYRSDNQDKPNDFNVVRSVVSNDGGVTWTNRSIIYESSKKGPDGRTYNAYCPYATKVGRDGIAVVFCTDEDKKLLEIRPDESFMSPSMRSSSIKFGLLNDNHDGFAHVETVHSMFPEGVVDPSSPVWRRYKEGLAIETIEDSHNYHPVLFDGKQNKQLHCLVDFFGGKQRGYLIGSPEK